MKPSRPSAAHPRRGQAPDLSRLAILVPTLNEEEGIAATLDAIPMEILRGQGWQVERWIVDGNSTDRTCAIARQRGASILVQEGRGKGQAFRQAVAALHCDALVMLDGDGTYPAESIPALAQALRDGADMARGSRFRGTIEPGAMPRPNRLGNLFISRLARLLFRFPVTDLNTGLLAFRKSTLNQLKLTADGFEIEAELFARAVQAKWTIVEVPITYRPRLGASKIGGMGTALRIFKTVLHLRLTH